MDHQRDVLGDFVMQWRRAVPEKLMALDGLLAEFKDPLPSAIAPVFRGLVVAGGAPSKNEQVTAAMDKTRDQVARALLDLSRVEHWIQMNVPQVEDGGNFGVAIQEETRKLVQAERVALKATLAKIPAYFKERGDAVEKLSSSLKTSQSKKTTQSDEQGKEDDKATTKTKTETVTTVTEDSSSNGAVSPDLIEQVVALDVNMYFELYTIASAVRDVYCVVADIVEKNEQKLTNPRGSGSSSVNHW